MDTENVHSYSPRKARKKLYEFINEKGNSKIKISFVNNDKNYLFELKDGRKFDYETLQYLNQEQYIKKIRV